MNQPCQIVSKISPIYILNMTRTKEKLFLRPTRCMPHYSWSLVLLALVTYEARAAADAATALLRRIAKNLSRVSCFLLRAEHSHRVSQKMTLICKRSDGFPGLTLNTSKVLFLASYCSRTVLTWWDCTCIETLALSFIK